MGHTTPTLAGYVQLRMREERTEPSTTHQRTMTAEEAVRLVQRTVLHNPEQWHHRHYTAKAQPLSDHIRCVALAAHPEKGQFKALMFNRDMAVFLSPNATTLRVCFCRGDQRLEVWENAILVDRVTKFEDMVSVQVWLADRYGCVLEFPLWLEKEVNWWEEHQA